MKCFLKKLILGAFLTLMMVGSTILPMEATARYAIYVDGYMLTASGKKIFNNREPRRRQIADLKCNFFIDNKGNRKVIILDCGAYDNVFHTGSGGEYESHHLISSSFCRSNPGIISVEEAPAVLIPKNVHCKTGSHSASKRSAQYLEAEQERFNKSGELEDVLELGLNDLKRTFRESGIDYGDILDEGGLIVTKLRKYAKLPDLLRKKQISEAVRLMATIQTPFSKTTLRMAALMNRSDIPTTPEKYYSGNRSNFPSTPVVENRPNPKSRFRRSKGYLQTEGSSDQPSDSNLPGMPNLEYNPSEKRRPEDDSKDDPEKKARFNEDYLAELVSGRFILNLDSD